MSDLSANKMDSRSVSTRPVSLIYLAVFVAVWSVAYFDVLITMVDVWAGSETYKHCFFIVPIVSYLFYERKTELADADYKPAVWMLLPLFGFQLVDLVGDLMSINLFRHGSAYLSLIGLIWVTLGTQFVIRFAFPLLYLGFVVPVGEELVPLLQDITAYLTVNLLNLTGIPVYREGLYLYIPNGTFLVAEACAGIRFLIGTIALGTLYSYMSFHTRYKFWGFIVLSVAVPILANGIRAYGIVAIGYYSDMEHATGADHLVYGWFFFAFVLVILFLLGERFKETFTAKEALKTTRSAQPLPIGYSMLVLACLVAPKIYSMVVNTPPAQGLQPVTLQSMLSKWPAQSEVFSWQAQLTNPNQTWNGKILGLDTHIAYFEKDDQQQEMVNGLNRYYNIENWTRKGQYVLTTSDGPVNVVELTALNGDAMTLVYFFEVDAKRTADALPTKLNQLLSKLSGRQGKGYFVSFVTQAPELDAGRFPPIGALP